MKRNAFRSFLSRFDPIRERLLENRSLQIGIFSVLVLLLSLMYPQGLVNNREYPEGSVWSEDDLIAAFAFPVYRDPAIVEREQKEAERLTPRSFDHADSVRGIVKDSIHSLLAALAAVCDAHLDASSSHRTDEYLRPRADSLERMRGKLGLPVHLTSPEWMVLFRLRLHETPRRGGEAFRSLYTIMAAAVDDVARQGYIDQEKSVLKQDRIALSNGTGIEDLVPVRQYLDFRDIPLYLKDRFTAQFRSEPEKVSTIVSILYPMLRPNIVYNEARTMVAVQAAIDRVPRTEGIVKENERIVSRHERVTLAIKSKLDSYNRAKQERSGTGNAILQFLGKIGHTIAILFPFVVYLFIFRKRIFSNNPKLILIAMLILLEGAIAWASFSSAFPDAIKFLILVPTAAMLLAIMFDSRVAFYATVSISFLVGAVRGNDYSIILASLLAGSLAVYTVRDIKHRTQIFRSLAFIFLGYAFAIAFDGLQRSTPLPVVSKELMFAFANALLSPVLTYGLLVLFEKAFGVTTDLTLLELSDFNHPLLRDLSARAPGTFHHSIVMGTLAEAASLAINANPTLARVGAYYHDIGKMLEPECFVENQMGAVNIHDTLDPKESARRILEHVTRGIELAREYGLPQRLIDFIPAHHGTTTVAYFLEKQRKANPDDADAAVFRYLGPKPLTKETAIVMLADTIEAAARAIEEPTIEKFEKLIDSVAARRLAEGELDDCELTLRDLTTIKKSFLTILTGIHHSRIKYPTEKDAEAARKIAERTSKLLNLPTTAEALTRRIKKIDSF